MKRARLFAVTVGVLLAQSVGTSCASKGQLGSETNWLGHCDSSDDCGKGTCMCGVCTVACTAGAACGGAVCVEKGRVAYVASCGVGASIPVGVCAASCSADRECAHGLRCVDGACVAPMGGMDAGPSATGTGDPDAHGVMGIPNTPPGRGAGDAGALEASRPCTPADWTTSDEAVAAVKARADFPVGSYLVSIAGPSNVNPTTDGKGEWVIGYSDATKTHSDSFGVCGSVIQHDKYTLAASSPSCDQGVTPLPSDVVMADALDRVSAFARYDRVSVSFEQKAACIAGGQLVQHVIVGGERFGDGGAVVKDEAWYADYSNGAVLRKLCGPCGVAQADCTPCIAGPDMPSSVGVATTDQSANGECIAFELGLTRQSTSLDSMGQLTNTKCVLALVELTDGFTYLMAGPAFDVDLATPDSDGDSVRHSASTAEDRLRNGIFPLKLYPRDALGDESQLIWSASLFIGSFDARARTAAFAVMASSTPQ